MARSENTSPVLIAYDGSDFAKGAIAEAANQLAAGRRAIVLTVSEPLGGIPFFGAAGAPVEPETMEGLVDAAEQSARKIAEEGAGLARDAGFDAEPLVVIGGPVWNLIVEAADQRGADLIVIGSRGRSGIAHILLGSVAAAVAQHSKRSVLIVHPRA
ncbi:MAG TPA: universal stress protein [Solirubrobacterales bacterium]|nr:universal stress protein [Solirubrobacterales bacterium]